MRDNSAPLRPTEEQLQRDFEQVVAFSPGGDGGGRSPEHRLIAVIAVVGSPGLSGSAGPCAPYQLVAQYLVDHIFVYRRDQNLPYKFSNV